MLYLYQQKRQRIRLVQMLCKYWQKYDTAHVKELRSLRPLHTARQVFVVLLNFAFVKGYARHDVFENEGRKHTLFQHSKILLYW